MSRVIKFRCFDTNKKVMIEDCSHVQRYGLEVMQFTGLTDFQGVEIYEGDIVQWDGDGTVSAIEWSEGDAGFLENPTANGFDGIRCEQFVVIGNIHQNPELLK